MAKSVIFNMAAATILDFAGYQFCRNNAGGHTPQPIFAQNGLIDVDSRKDVPFAVKIKTFSNPWPQIWKITAKNRPL